MANNLLRQGFRVVAAYDTDATRLAALPQDVARTTSPRQVAAAADVIVTGDLI